MVLSLISLHRKRRKSAVLISRWWRKIFKQARQALSGNAILSRNVEITKTMIERKSSIKWKAAGPRMSEIDRGGSMKRISMEDGNNRSDLRNSGNVGLRAAVDRVMSMNRQRAGKYKSSSMADITLESDHSDDLGHDGDSHDDGDEGKHFPPVPEHIHRLGMSAFQAMMDAEKEGEICIVEKSYVLIGVPLQDQSLFFCALQNLIDAEREVRISYSLLFIFL